MVTQERRATSSAMWLERWKGCEAAGEPMSEYARREGFDGDAAYRWKRILIRTGQWTGAQPVPRSKRKKGAGAVRFARVALQGLPPASMVLRLMLSNGRRAELQIGGAAHLGEVIEVLERIA